MKFDTVHIYGLFCHNGECLYVGRTVNPKVRERTHRSSDTTKGIPFKFKIISKCNLENCYAEESKAIKNYKEKGEARLNLNGFVGRRNLATIDINPALLKRLKIAAFESGVTLGFFTETALSEFASKLEKKPGKKTK